MNLRKNGNKYLIILEIIALIIVLIYGALHVVMPSKPDRGTIPVEQSEAGDEGTAGDTEQNPGVEQETQQDLQPVTYSDTVKAKVQEMTTEEKVCQLFLTRPEEITGVGQFTQAGNKTKAAISKYPLGGLIFSDANFGGKAATQKMMKNVQKYASDRIGILMFLAVNEPGGDQSPLASKNRYEKEPNPVEWQSTENAAGSTAKIAGYIKDSGLNMNFAPSANLAGTANAGEEKETFGDDSVLASNMVSTSIAYYKENGVYTVAKTFPGENIEKPEEQLAPFQSASEADVTVMMVGNNVCESITGDAAAPCCTSANAMTYLRNTLHYSGVIMTGDLSAGLSDGSSIDSAAVAAVKAGADMIYVSKGFENSYQAVLDAVNQGEISKERLEDAVSRVLTAKGM